MMMASSDRGTEEERIVAELGESVVRAAFAVGMALKSAVTRADDAVTERVESAMDTLDGLMAEVRGVVLERREALRP